MTKLPSVPHHAARGSDTTKRDLPYRRGPITYAKINNNSLRRNPDKKGLFAIQRNAKQPKNLKFVSASCSKVAEEAFRKLDPSVPEQVKRLQTRRRMISYGKNTVGYDEYLRQVPKEKRRPRCMETPQTPDYTLDMPNKRWVGQVRAWRRALHNYDPPDLQTSFTEAAKEAARRQQARQTGNQEKSVQDIQLEQAKADGLPVQFAPSSGENTTVQTRSNELDELDQWEDKRNSIEDNFDDFVSEGGDLSDEESDDDLL